MRSRTRAALELMAREERGYTFTEMADELGGPRGLWSFALAELERLGMIARAGRSWSSARVTETGLEELRKPGRSRQTTRSPRGLARDGGTMYPGTVERATEKSRVLRPGRDNAKLGGIVSGGRHAGLEIYSLTLEEGRTCPPCDLADRCYGGNMNMARRWTDVEDAVRRETTSRMLVRLHVLGDFYSLDYARVWGEQIVAPTFGYTRRRPGESDGIGDYLSSLPWSRHSIRQSWAHAPGRTLVRRRGAVTVARAAEAAEHDAIVCPEQTGAARNCASCGLCWNTERNIAFLEH